MATHATSASQPGAASPSGRPARPDGGGRRGPLRNRRGLWLLILGLMILIALAVADRVAEVLAAHRLASTVQSSQHLSSRPTVTIRGFPFLTQVLRGRYTEVDLSSKTPVSQNGVEVSAVNLRLHGVRVTASDVVHGTVRNVFVQSGTGTALITYPELNSLFRRFGGTIGSAVTVTPTTPGHAKLNGPLGLSLDFAAAVTDGRLVVAPDRAELQGLPSFVRDAITSAVATPITLPAFPYNLSLASGHLEPNGLVLTGVAKNSLFPVR